MADKQQATFLLLILITLVVGLLLFFFLWESTPSVQPPPQVGAPQPVGSLGAEIYEKAKNPLEGKLPSANPAEAVDPLEGVYQNPFE